MRHISFFILISIAFLFSTARADLLPDVENVQISGQTLSWDAQAGATGYNIIRDRQYYDTVRGPLSYELNESGSYSVIAFNDMDDFGSDHYLEEVEYTATKSNASINYNYNYRALYVYKTCTNVGPGEACIASCPRSYNTGYRDQYFDYLSGGACSTSDIVEADAFLGPDAYKCTVPTFSGEVTAQAVCVMYD